MKALQQNLAKLEGADTQVLGVSMDSPFSNFAFAQQNGIGFPILGDWGGPVTSRYGLTQKFDIQAFRWRPRGAPPSSSTNRGKSSTNRSMTRPSIRRKPWRHANGRN